MKNKSFKTFASITSTFFVGTIFGIFISNNIVHTFFGAKKITYKQEINVKQTHDPETKISKNENAETRISEVKNKEIKNTKKKNTEIKNVKTALVSYSDEAFYKIKDIVFQLEHGVFTQKKTTGVGYDSFTAYKDFLIGDSDNDGKNELVKIITYYADEKLNYYAAHIEEGQSSDFIHLTEYLGNDLSIFAAEEYFTNFFSVDYIDLIPVKNICKKQKTIFTTFENQIIKYDSTDKQLRKKLGITSCEQDNSCDDG